MNELKNKTKTVVVTGASTGIGEAIALDLAAEGWQVIATGRREDKLAEVLEKLNQISDVGHVAARMDVADLAQLEEKLLEFDSEYSIDALVNNAGISYIHRFLDIVPEKYQTLMDINMRGLFFATQIVAKCMIAAENTSGTIVNVASMGGKEGGVELLSDYIGSKFGVIGFTQATAQELGRYGIRVNAVCPGYIRTEMQEREEVWESEMTGEPVESIQKKFADRAALGSIGFAQDIAPTVSFLLSEKSGFITGESVAINGGVYMD